MFCQCFHEWHGWKWHWAALRDECQEFWEDPSWNEAQDILWGIWRLFDHHGRYLWFWRLATPGKYRKHAKRMQERGCFRSERHPSCAERR